MAQGIQPPTRESWELAGVVLGVLGAVYAAIRWPVRWLHQRATMNALDVCRKDLRHLIDELYAEEIKQIKKSTELTKAHADILVAHEASIEAFGIAMRDIPRMSDAMVGLTEAVRELKGAVFNLNDDVKQQAGDLGRVTGFVDGLERRRRGRRKNDPPMEDG